MRKIDLSEISNKKEYLNRYSLTITEVRRLLGIGRDRATILVSQVRAVNAAYYKKMGEVFGLTCVAPLHLMVYLGWTREEFFKYLD